MSEANARERPKKEAPGQGCGLTPWIPAFAGMSNRVGLGCDGLCCFGVADDGVEMGDELAH
ncbi:hypothetical protein, partial [Amorphus sp. MBR-141]